jgi:hypothetical protein
LKIYSSSSGENGLLKWKFVIENPSKMGIIVSKIHPHADIFARLIRQKMVAISRKINKTGKQK